MSNNVFKQQINHFIYQHSAHSYWFWRGYTKQIRQQMIDENYHFANESASEQVVPGASGK